MRPTRARDRGRFSFGARSYWLITGRHALPARSFDQFRALWSSPLRTPYQLDHEIPRALSDLVMDCLALNPAARPRSAAVVTERVCGIASLPLEEHPDVAVAYLTTPRLVGRGAPLLQVRTRMLSCLWAKGAVFCVRGAPGSGRTRFIEACMLEAKLQGATVLRIGPGDAAQGEFGALRSLCEELIELAPETAERAARLRRGTLDHVLGRPQPDGSQPPTSERRHQLASVRDFTLATTRGMRRVLAADDVHLIDEGSVSVLLSLAQKVRRRTACLLFALDHAQLADGARSLDESPLPRRTTLSTSACYETNRPYRWLHSRFARTISTHPLSKRSFATCERLEGCAWMGIQPLRRPSGVNNIDEMRMPGAVSDPS